jgi:hypothetical protein
MVPHQLAQHHRLHGLLAAGTGPQLSVIATRPW